MSGAYSTNGLGEKCIQSNGWKVWREETTSKYQYSWENNIRMDIIALEVVDWIHVA